MLQVNPDIILTNAIEEMLEIDIRIRKQRQFQPTLK